MIHCEVEICVGCRMCEVVCSSVHFGAVSPALSRIRVAKLEDTGIDLAIACMSCTEKPCLECPTDALSVGAKGEIQLEVGLCNGCETCVEACPVGAVGFHDEEPLFCDLCDGVTSCVEVCPSGALSFRHDGKISLEDFLQVEGYPSERRVHYAAVQAAPMRERWKAGARVDT